MVSRAEATIFSASAEALPFASLIIASRISRASFNKESLSSLASFNIFSLLDFNEAISSLALCAAFSASAIELSLSFNVLRMGFQANFFRIRNTMPKDIIIQNNKPIEGVTNSMFCCLLKFKKCLPLSQPHRSRFF